VHLDADWLKSAEVAWDDLLRDSAAHPIFLSWAWTATWAEMAEPGRAVRMVGLYEGNDLIALLPSTVRGQSYLPYRRLEFIGQNGSGGDYLDLICRHGAAARATEALVDWWASASNRPWSYVALHGCRTDSLTASVAEHSRRTCEVQPWQSGLAPYLPIRTSWDEYFQSRFSSKKRHNLDRQLRLAKQRFDLDLQLYTRREDVERLLPRVFDLHDLRRANLDGRSAFTGPRARAFHLAAGSRLAQRGKVVIATLENKRTPVAAAYCFRDPIRLSYFQTGYDPAFDPASPGTVLLMSLIKRAFEEGLQEFDFLNGDEPYKYTWTDDVRPLYGWRAFPHSVSGVVASRSLAAVRHLKGLAKRLKQAVDGVRARSTKP
jgi:CelD/BcsL family acetyltransferase involved in cellulose biosynthesis